MIEYLILINKYGQGLSSNEKLLSMFSASDLIFKRKLLYNIINLTLQSKPKEEDINQAISESKLRPTYTPCVLLTKGVVNHNLLRIASLPENELTKAYILLLSLFKIAYRRRFEEERNDPNKWWYWDLSDENNIMRILQECK